MKRKYSIGVILLAFVLSACENWLDVKPELDIYEETLFEEAKGYYVGLNGLYVKMSSKSLYGQELSWGAVEAWGRSYTLNENNHAGYFQMVNFEYDKTEAVNIRKDIWLSAYKVIAEANNLIQNLEKDEKVKFKYGDVTKNMILAEAYAVRALMHFELVRIFAQAPIVDNGGISSFVPWVTVYPSLVNAPRPTREVLQNIIGDLEKAKEWIKPFDTDADYPGYACFLGTNAGTRIKLESNIVGVASDEDEFFRYRANRLNYYAITALLARVSLYTGENDKAFENANEIVNLVNAKENYVFVAPGNVGNTEPRLHSEILFGGYNSNLPDLTEPYFDVDNVEMLLVLNDRVGIFEENPLDVRLQAIPGNVVTKFSLKTWDEAISSVAKALEPVLRFPECYYIAAEAIFDKDKAKAIEIFNQVVEARGNDIYKLNANVDKETFMEFIVKEYRREFLGEGYLVYVYKRLNIPLRANGTTIAHDGKLVLPVPDIEAGLQ